MSHELKQEIDAFFRSYCAAFEALDADAIADCFAFPSHIASDADEVSLIPIANRQECLTAVDKVVALHRELGAPAGRIHDLTIHELSPQLVQASLRMEVLDGTANFLYDFEATYSLAKLSGRWRIAAISHNQIPRLLRCVAEHRPRP